MSALQTIGRDQPRDPLTGRALSGSTYREPPAPLLDSLRFIARASVRRVFNDPRTTTHVERLCLHWLMHWDPIEDQPIRAYIGLKAGNEARRIKAMKPAAQTEAFARSWDRPRLESRSHRPDGRTSGGRTTVRPDVQT